MRVRELMSDRVVTIGTAASGHEAIELMAKHTMRHLPVVASDGSLAGMVTDRDVRHHLFRPEVFTEVGSVDVQSLLKNVTVSEMMSWPPVTTTADASITDAAALMRRSRVGSLLVIDGTRLLGILTETDLLRELVRADGCCCPEVESNVVSYP
jgi:acetoin utilization protein AcuB